MKNKDTEKVKLKKRVVFTFILSVFALLMCLVYFVVAYPMLSFLVNDMSTVSNNTDVPVIQEGESLIDMSALSINVDISDSQNQDQSQELNPSQNQNNGDASGGNTSGSTGDSFVNNSQNGGSSGGNVQYAPDPIVSGVKKTTGKSLYFEPDAHNVLVLGQDNSSGLMDTIMIISICDRLNTVQVASIARDAYVPYTRNVVDALESRGYGNSIGIYKINASAFIGNYVVNYTGGKFSNSGIDFMCSVLSQLLPNSNCDIDEYIYMNEDGFLDIINVIGGLEVYVTEDIYNGDGKLVWTKGYHHMNARQCLNYVSARYRFNASGRVGSTGDPYRKANQLSFMRDFAQQIVTVDNIPKFPDLMNSVKRNVWHSFNTASDITKYSEIALKYAKNQYKMSMYVVSGKSIDPMGDGASYVNLMS